MSIVKHTLIVCFFALFILFSNIAVAEESTQPDKDTQNYELPDETSRVGFFAHIGYGFGGDKILTLELIDDDGDSDNQSVKAGEGLIVGGGLLIPLGGAGNIEAQLGISWKEKKITAENGKVAFHRIPLDAMIFYKADKVRLGGGVTYHLNPELSGHGYVGGVDASFENAFGFVAEADMVFQMFFVGIRGEFIDYEFSDSPIPVELDGNNVEILLGVRF